jgi:F-type H+-transporting ATPase subunit epsilon
MIQVELITPERLTFKDTVDSLVAPAPDGEVGILSHHAPLLTRLGVGELRFKKGAETFFIAITGGFMEVQQGSRVSIFAETAEFAEEIDVERARLAAERAKSKLVQASDLTAAELAQVEAALSRAVLRINLAKTRWRKLPPEKPEAH